MQDESITRHAPRERVSWNLQGRFSVTEMKSHAPRERVSWNDHMKELVDILSGHAPRERVSWNCTYSAITKNW